MASSKIGVRQERERRGGGSRPAVEQSTAKRKPRRRIRFESVDAVLAGVLEKFVDRLGFVLGERSSSLVEVPAVVMDSMMTSPMRSRALPTALMYGLSKGNPFLAAK